ncbi:hypothetical protein F4604DRAFT_1907202 [Suillus subluteus]|nr:hypothetical protein F4604DRAFT_1907202 [Suillus subluteus]
MTGTLHPHNLPDAPSLALPLSEAVIQRSAYLLCIESPKLTISQSICFLVLVLGRIVNALLPLTLGALITTFDIPCITTFPAFGASLSPYIITYVRFRFLASSGGLAAIRDAFWISLMQYSDRSMTFNHILALSLSWHTKRKTGELLRTLNRISTINRVGELIEFTVIPVLMDVCSEALWLES